MSRHFRSLILCLTLGLGCLCAQDTTNEARMKSQIRVLLDSLKDANRTAQEALAIHHSKKQTSSKEDKNTLAEALAKIESQRLENNLLHEIIYQMVAIVNEEAPLLSVSFDQLLQEVEKIDSSGQGIQDASTANIIGYDTHTGLVILGIGEAQGVKPGMQYVFFGSDSRENRLVVTDVREQIAGALVLEGASPIQLGLEVNLVIEN